jgi:hypothetical protein
MQFIFRLYHGINEQEVTEIFKSFPYLYLCEQTKLQKFLGEFRKYRMTKEQIIRLVSIFASFQIVQKQRRHSC